MNPFARQILCIVLSVISLIVSQFSTIPQLFTLKKTRNTSGISLMTYIVFVSSSLFWSIWTYLFYFSQMMQKTDPSVTVEMHQWGMIPAIIMNNANLLIMTVVLAIKIHHLKLCKQMQITELELSKILLHKDNEKYKRFGYYEGFRRYLVQIILITVFALLLAGSSALVAIYGIPAQTGKPSWSPVVIVFNAIGAVSWEVVSWPQFIKSMKEKDTTGVSLAWAIFLPVSCTILFFSDLLMGFAGEGFDIGIIFSLVFNGMISAYAVLVLKIKNIKAAKNHNLSEEEYTKKYLIPEVIKKKQMKAAEKAKKEANQ